MKILKIAIQKSGRLYEKSAQLLRQTGIEFEHYKDVLIAPSRTFPVEVLFLRDDDIPEYVQDGIADLGICGTNIINETGANVCLLQKLNFGKCDLKIAVPHNSSFQSLNDLQGLSIATSYPNILKQFLLEKNICAETITVNGSVEISPSLGLSSAICDLVSTGSTLRSNGLRELYTVLQSEAQLIANRHVVNDNVVQELCMRVKAVLHAMGNKYVVLNVEMKNLPKVSALLPGIKSPTVIPLAEVGWIAMHTVISESDFWVKINQLKNAGAQDIAVMNMEKLIL